MYSIKFSAHQVKEARGPYVMDAHHVWEQCKDMSGLCQETLQIITLNSKSRVIDRHLVSMGSINSAPFHPRDIFRCAILDNAAAIIAVHNHPSGDPTPSKDDIELTKSMIEAGTILGIRVLDHIVIGRDEYISIFRSGHIG